MQDTPDAGDSPRPGQPTLYKPDYDKQVEKLCLLGATDCEIADFFNVDVRTIYRWKVTHESFCQATKAGKEIADERVERSLYQKAVGYEQDEVKIFNAEGAPLVVPFRAKIAPDTGAAIFWLKNRRSQSWREKIDHNVTGEIKSTSEMVLSPETAEAMRAMLASASSGDAEK